MKRLSLGCLLILCSNLLWSLPSTPAKTESTTCFSDSELAAFEAEVQAEVEKAAVAAVQAATAPLYADISKLTNQKYLLIGATFISTAGLVAALVVLFSIVKPITASI